MNRSHEYALVLLQKARDDLYVLERLATDADAPTWSLGFHAQQAAEKSLKAVLASKSVDFPRTHNLALLIDLLSGQNLSLPPDFQNLPQLTPYGATLRYDIEPEGDAERAFDRTLALEMARRTAAWAQSILE
jgi:HEPN domain-containing protein